MTQPERLQAHLDTLQPITRLTALTELGIFELSSRIGELTKSGYPIQRKMITVVNRWGEKVRVMEYKKKQQIKELREWQR